MTRLQLCQDLHRILRIDSNLPGTAPTATTGQTGVLREIVDFIDESYRRIQSAEEWWGFRLTQGTFPTVASTRAYTRTTVQSSLSTFDQYLVMSGYGTRHVQVYLTGVEDMSPCFYIPYQEWRGLWDRGERPEGKPAYFTVRQDQTIEFDPTPDDVYTISLDYRRTLHTLTSDSTEPLFAADYHDAIVWGGVLAYCRTRESVGELRSEAFREYNRLLNAMRIRYLPELVWDGSLLWGSQP